MISHGVANLTDMNYVIDTSISLEEIRVTLNTESNIYTLRSKLRLFNTLVKPVLLYGSETWKIKEGDNRKLDQFFSGA